MKVIYGELDHDAKTVYLADKEKGWVMSAGYEFKIHGILFAAIPMAKFEEMFVVHVESGQLLFSPDMPKAVADDTDKMMYFIKEQAMIPASLIIQKEGINIIKAENAEYVKQSFDLFGPKPEGEYLREMDLSKLEGKKLNYFQ